MSQLAVPTVSQLLVVPSPRQTRLVVTFNGVTTTLTVSVRLLKEFEATYTKLASPEKPADGVNCALWLSPSNATTPLLALETAYAGFSKPAVYWRNSTYATEPVRALACGAASQFR